MSSFIVCFCLHIYVTELPGRAEYGNKDGVTSGLPRETCANISAFAVRCDMVLHRSDVAPSFRQLVLQI